MSIFDESEGIMILYTVLYRIIGKHKWSKLENVKGDGLVENQNRFFILEDETRYEIPYSNVEFKFSKERYLQIVERLSNEAGQNIKIDKR